MRLSPFLPTAHYYHGLLEQIDELREMHGCHCDGNKTKNTSA
jgi:hypothetical protein